MPEPTQEQLTDPELLTLYEQGSEADWDLLSTDELSRMHEVVQTRKAFQQQIERIRSNRQAGSRVVAVAEAQAAGDPGALILSAGSHSPQPKPRERSAVENGLRTAFSLADSMRGGMVGQNLRMVNALASWLPFDAPPALQRDSTANPFALEQMAEIRPAAEYGENAAEAMTLIERMTGMPWGRPGTFGAGAEYGFDAWDYRKAQLEQVGRIATSVPRWLWGIAKSIQEAPHVALNQPEVFEERAREGFSALLGVFGYEAVEHPARMYGGNYALPWLITRKAPAEGDDIAPSDMPHPTEGDVPAPQRWFGTFGTPLMPWHQAGADLTTVALRVRQYQNLMRHALTTIAPAYAQAQAERLQRVGSAVKVAPDVADMLASDLLAGYGQDLMDQADDELRARMWRERPEAVLFNIADTLWALGAAGRAAGMLPKTATIWTNIRATRALLQTGPDGAVMVHHRAHVRRLWNAAQRALERGRGTRVAQSSRAVLEGARDAGESAADAIDEAAAAAAASTDRGAKVRSVSRSITAMTLNDDVAYLPAHREAADKVKRALDDAGEWISGLQDDPRLGPAARDMAERLDRVRKLRETYSNALDEAVVAPEDLTRELDGLADDASRLGALEGEFSKHVPQPEAKMGEILEAMAKTQSKGLENQRDLVRLLEEYRRVSKVGGAIGAGAGLAALTHALYGDEGANDFEMLAAVGPLPLLAVLTPGVNAVRLRRTFEATRRMLASKAMVHLYRAPGTSRAKLLEALRGDEDAAVVLRELERLARGKSARLAEPARAALDGLVDDAAMQLAESEAGAALAGRSGLQRLLRSRVAWDGAEQLPVFLDARVGLSRLLGSERAELAFRALTALEAERNPGEAMTMAMQFVQRIDRRGGLGKVRKGRASTKRILEGLDLKPGEAEQLAAIVSGRRTYETGTLGTYRQRAFFKSAWLNQGDLVALDPRTRRALGMVTGDTVDHAGYNAALRQAADAFNDSGMAQAPGFRHLGLTRKVEPRDLHAMLWSSQTPREAAADPAALRAVKSLIRRGWESAGRHAWSTDRRATILRQVRALRETKPGERVVFHPGSGRLLDEEPAVALRVGPSKAWRSAPPEAELMDWIGSQDELAGGRGYLELARDQDGRTTANVVRLIAKPDNRAAPLGRLRIDAMFRDGALPDGTRLANKNHGSRWQRAVRSGSGLAGFRRALEDAGAEPSMLALFDDYASDVAEARRFDRELRAAADGSVEFLDLERRAPRRGAGGPMPLSASARDLLSAKYADDWRRMFHVEHSSRAKTPDTAALVDELTGARRVDLEAMKQAWRGSTRRGLLNTISAGALGAGIGATVGAAGDRETQVGVLTGMLAGPLFGWGLMRFMREPVVRDAMFDLLSIGKGPRGRGVRAAVESIAGGTRLAGGKPSRLERARELGRALRSFGLGHRLNTRETELARSLTPEDIGNLERVFDKTFWEWLPPEVRVDPRAATIAGSTATALAGGATAGALASYPDETQTGNLARGVAIAAGSIVGARMGTLAFGRLLRDTWAPRLAMKRLFTEGKGLPADYLEQRRRVLASLAGSMLEIKHVTEELHAMGPGVGDMVDDFLRGARALEDLPEAARFPAVQVRQIFDEMTMGLVETGIMQGAVKQVALSRLGSYLPRLYLKYERSQGDDALQAVQRWAQAKGISTWRMGDVHGLMKRQDLPPEVRKALGEITDNPAYLLARRGPPTQAAIHARRMQNWIASSEHTLPDEMLFRKVSDKEAIAYAERMGIPVPDTRKVMNVRLYAQRMGWKVPNSTEEYESVARRMQDDLADLKRHMRSEERGGAPEAEEFAQRGRKFARWQGRTYMRMPNKDNYGPLAGKFVDEAIALDEITKVETPDSFLELLEQTGTALFKSSKVLWNPATLARNLVSNVILLDQAGVNLTWRPGKESSVIRAIREFPIRTGIGSGRRRPPGEMFIEARKAGLFGGEFRAGEIESLLDGIQDSKARGAHLVNLLSHNARNLFARGDRGLLKRMEQFHEASEQFSKMIAYAHARNNLGMTSEGAVRFAKSWIFDYTEVSDFVKIARKSIFGAPFITFSYKAIPRILENALAVGDPKKLLRFWKWPLILGAVNELSARTLGEEPKNEPTFLAHLKKLGREALNMAGDAAKPEMWQRILFGGAGVGDPHNFKRWLPDWAGTTQILLPWVDDFGRLQSFDATWYFPWGDLGEFGQGTLGRNLARAGLAFPRWLEPGNPWLHAMVASLTGRDAFTGRDIISPGAGVQEATADLTRYFVRLWGPPLINSEGRSWQKLHRAYAQERLGAETSDPFTPSLSMAIASEVFGLKVRAFDPELAWQYRFRARNRVLSRLDFEIDWLERSGAPLETLQRKERQRVAIESEFDRRFGIRPPRINHQLVRQIAERSRKRYRDLAPQMRADPFGLGPGVAPANAPDYAIPPGFRRQQSAGMLGAIYRSLTGGQRDERTKEER